MEVSVWRLTLEVTGPRKRAKARCSGSGASTGWASLGTRPRDHGSPPCLDVAGLVKMRNGGCPVDQPGSIPAFVMTGRASGAVRTFTSALAASDADAAVCRPAAYTVMFWISAGNGPT